MSTPPNQPEHPSGPPTEPTGTPIPAPASDTPSAPEPAQPLSLRKTPEPTPEPTPTPAPAPAPAPEAQPEPAPAPAPQPAPAPAFAPPAPVPPAPSFGAPAAPVPPGGAWGAHPGAIPGNPWGTPPPATTNGLAVAALILGIAAVLIGLIPFIFWAGALLAVVGIGIGIGALVRASKGAGRKSMAVTGTVLAVLGLGSSVGGLFLTGLVVTNVADAKLKEGWKVPDDIGGSRPPVPRFSPKPLPSPSPTQVPGITSPLPFGETYTYPNGIKVTLSAPKKYVTKNKYSTVGNAVEFTLTITNNSTETHNVIYAVPNVRDDKGMTAKLAFDGGDVPKMIRGDILPGESASGILAYEVPEGTDHLSADISPGIRLPSAKFSGSIG
ncbi:hypothetical protein [Streptomyces sp. NBC_01006]|uniref:DUF4190 domain-containing protein n=1 Tax=Streptomyces sp. NBC_01006 TaxID=2903716 RepID=UPI00386C23B6|nr:hypothetical protein OG509_12220 [Streptomyces sp. NBC_01006]